MQPLGNVGRETQTIETVKNILNDKGETVGTEKLIKSLTGNAGIYQEIAKKKFPYSKAGQTVNFFATKKELKLGNDYNSGGKTYLLDPLGVSYLHWRNRHIFLDSESMIPLKLQSGEFKPSSRLWYQLFELGLLIGLHKGASTAPAKTKNTNTTMIILGIVMFALGYFVALMYGHQLSPAFNPQTITSTSTSVLQSIHSSITTTTVQVINGTTITKTVIVQAP